MCSGLAISVWPFKITNQHHLRLAIFEKKKIESKEKFGTSLSICIFSFVKSVIHALLLSATEKNAFVKPFTMNMFFCLMQHYIFLMI